MGNGRTWSRLWRNGTPCEAFSKVTCCVAFKASIITGKTENRTNIFFAGFRKIKGLKVKMLRF